MKRYLINVHLNVFHARIFLIANIFVLCQEIIEKENAKIAERNI